MRYVPHKRYCTHPDIISGKNYGLVSALPAWIVNSQINVTTEYTIKVLTGVRLKNPMNILTALAPMSGLKDQLSMIISAANGIVFRAEC